MKFVSAIVFASVFLALTVSASAQNAPYSPKAASVSSLLKSSSYRESPLALEFPQTDYRTVVAGNRMDFEHTYDVSYADLVQHLINAYEEKKKVMTLETKFAPHIKNHDIYVMGIQPGGDTARFTLGSKSVPIRFTIDIRPGGLQTIVVVRNAVFSQLFSGIMPARAGYKPTEGKPVGFRWN